MRMMWLISKSFECYRSKGSLSSFIISLHTPPLCLPWRHFYQRLPPPPLPLTCSAATTSPGSRSMLLQRWRRPPLPCVVASTTTKVVVATTITIIAPTVVCSATMAAVSASNAWCTWPRTPADETRHAPEEMSCGGSSSKVTTDVKFAFLLIVFVAICKASKLWHYFFCFRRTREIG